MCDKKDLAKEDPSVRPANDRLLRAGKLEKAKALLQALKELELTDAELSEISAGGDSSGTQPTLVNGAIID